MAQHVVTPLTQALAEGRLSRDDLKSLMQRNDHQALIRLVLWVLTLCGTGGLIWLSMDSWLVWVAMFVHGIVIVHHFSLQHECVHYTVFRTRWLNDVIGNLCGLVIILPHQFFRYEHCDHHTYTQLHGEDPELVPMPKTLGEYLFYLSSIAYWRAKFTELFRHAVGRLTEAERRFIPKTAQHIVFTEARVMVVIYAALIAVMWATGWLGPVWYWFVPLMMGEPVMRFIRMTEHVGRPTVPQMSENTRTNLVSWPWRFLGWNMNYHAEHHYASSVPFHALPKLHDKLRDHIHVEPGGYLGAHRDILRQLFGTSTPSDGLR